MWQFARCEVQGTGHKKSQIPCQDKTFTLSKNGVYVIALADGAGSASLSHYGAERVVRDVSMYISEHFLRLLNCNDGREVKKELVEMLQTGLTEEAEARKCNVNDLSSTLLLAAVRENDFILAHIGDGVIGYLDGGELKVASMPDNGEFSNVTTFVTSIESLASMRVFKGKLNNKDAFVLMSDGTEQSLYHKPTKKLADVVKKLMHRTCLIDSEVMDAQLTDAFNSVIAKNTQDDCSIAILARPSKVLCPITTLSLKERLDLYEITSLGHWINRPGVRYQVLRYDAILAFTDEPHSLQQIARSIHLRPKYTKKHIKKLVVLGLLEEQKGIYQNAKRSKTIFQIQQARYPQS